MLYVLCFEIYQGGLETLTIYHAVLVWNYSLLNTEVKELRPYQTQVCFSIELLYNSLIDQSIFSIDAM